MRFTTVRYDFCINISHVSVVCLQYNTVSECFMMTQVRNAIRRIQDKRKALSFTVRLIIFDLHMIRFSVIKLTFDVIPFCRTALSQSASCPRRSLPVHHGYTVCRLFPALRAARARLPWAPTRSSSGTVCESALLSLLVVKFFTKPVYLHITSVISSRTF